MRRREDRGAALVEFALVLPLIMLLLLGMLDFGKAFTIWIDETHLANSAARYAAVNSAPTAGCNGCLESEIENQADTEELKDSFSTPTTPPTPPNGICIEFPKVGSVGAKGDPVKVVVTGQTQFFAFLKPFLGGAAKKTLQASATMRLEQDYHPSPATNTYTGLPAGSCPS